MTENRRKGRVLHTHLGRGVNGAQVRLMRAEQRKEKPIKQSKRKETRQETQRQPNKVMEKSVP